MAQSLVMMFTLMLTTLLPQMWCGPGKALAVTRVGIGGAASGAAATLAVTIPATTAGNTLVAVVGGASTANFVTSITGGGTWAQAVASLNAGTQATEIWYCTNITAGVTSVTVNKSAIDSTAIIYEYSGVLTVAPLDKTAVATGSSATQSSGTTTVTAVANELWIGGFSTNVAGTYSTAATGWTTVSSFGTVVGAGFFENLANSATTAVVDVTGPNGIYAGAIATFLPPSATLTVSLLGVGIGAVNSNPPGIACTSSVCSYAFTDGTPVTLTAIPDWKSLFTGWGLPCSGSGTCFITLNGAAGVTATFDINGQTKIIGMSTVTYGSLQDVYVTAKDGDIVAARVYTFTENLTLDSAISITLDGGKNSFYLTTVGYTTLQGALSVDLGTVIIENLIIQ